jgi:hypothetical protein
MIFHVVKLEARCGLHRSTEEAIRHGPAVFDDDIASTNLRSLGVARDQGFAITMSPALNCCAEAALAIASKVQANATRKSFDAIGLDLGLSSMNDPRNMAQP